MVFTAPEGGSEPQSPTSTPGSTPFERGQAASAPQPPQLLDRVTGEQLAALPLDVRARYRAPEVAGGLHVLNVAPATAPSKPDVTRSEAFKARALAVDAALASMGVQSKNYDDARAWLMGKVQVIEDGGTVRAVFPGRDNTPCRTIGEALAHWQDTDDMRELSKWLPPPAPAAPTPEEAALADSSPLPEAPPANVTITESQAQNFAEYERARKLARQQGGEVLIVPDAPKPVTRDWVDGKDVPLTALQAADFSQYEEASRVARSQGGRVVVIDSEKDYDAEAMDRARQAGRLGFLGITR